MYIKNTYLIHPRHSKYVSLHPNTLQIRILYTQYITNTYLIYPIHSKYVSYPPNTLQIRILYTQNPKLFYYRECTWFPQSGTLLPRSTFPLAAFCCWASRAWTRIWSSSCAWWSKSKVKFKVFFFFFWLLFSNFFFSERIDKTSPLLHFHTCRSMLLLLGRNLSAELQLNVYTSRIY